MPSQVPFEIERSTSGIGGNSPRTGRRHDLRRCRGSITCLVRTSMHEGCKKFLTKFPRCFKTLGPFFTFEITIRPKHHLITGGPYAWVRHPSYTGVYLTLFGASLALWSPETLNVGYASQTADWTASLGPIWHARQRTFGMAFAGVWVAKCLFACHGMTTRMKKEDNILEATFRESWEDYAERVPWKLIPGIW